jgi:uncharacterized protein GlcG (DUF336 family)
MTSITLSQAQALLSRGIQHIRDRHAKDICLSVCDAQGFLICFARMDAAPLRSIEIAQRKAYTSVRVGLTTTAFHAKLKQADLQIGYYGDTHLTAMAGGAVITDAQGATLGGVGVSGLLPHEDQAIADELAQLAGTL